MKKVLLASAAKVFLRRKSDMLQKRGFQLFTVTTGADALKLHKEYIFDLIISDFKLDDMNGCTLCKLLRELPGDNKVPVILVCHNLRNSIERVQQANPSAILVKPVNPVELLEKISGFIDLPIGRSRRVVFNVNVISRALGLEFTCISHDISSTGILVETEQELGLGSHVSCRFQLPGSSVVEVDGEIGRMLCTLGSATLYGIKFLELPLTASRAIADYVKAVVHREVESQLFTQR